MKKDLPNVFHKPITKDLQNNSRIFYGKGERQDVSVEELFQTNQIYRTNVKLTLKDKTVEKTIIGRTQNNLITFDNEIISINDILKIEVL